MTPISFDFATLFYEDVWYKIVISHVNERPTWHRPVGFSSSSLG